MPQKGLGRQKGVRQANQSIQTGQKPRQNKKPLEIFYETKWLNEIVKDIRNSLFLNIDFLRNKGLQNYNMRQKKLSKDSIIR